MVVTTIAETTIAETTFGPVQGRIKDDVLLFAGIPYAAAPTGELRFKAAQPHAGWSETRQATRFSPAAPQIPTGGMTDNAPVNWNEDCLFLNITTPMIDNNYRPVFFWIHGGGYRTGQGAIPWYNGANFALNGDIVVVSINYRMGALGFADLSRFGAEYATSGVNGTLDQITALKWVRENISNFGGDPNQITIAGESAGGFSVCTILGSPIAQGLFQRAIPQSGAAHHTLPKDAAEKVTDLFLGAMSASSIEELQSAPVEDILKVQSQIDLDVSRGGASDLGVAVSPFYPCEDNEVLPESPLKAIADGMGSNVDVLVGSNKDEGTLFVTGNMDETKLDAVLLQYGGGQDLLDAYRASFPDADVSALATHLSTDHVFRIPALRLAEARAKHGANTWMYLFAWESRIERLKSTHALEIPFVFNNLDKAGVEAFIGPGELPQGVADAMHQAWINFIRDGDPGWPPYDLVSRSNMKFDTSSKLVSDPDSGRREAWEGIR